MSYFLPQYSLDSIRQVETSRQILMLPCIIRTRPIEAHSTVIDVENRGVVVAVGIRFESRIVLVTQDRASCRDSEIHAVVLFGIDPEMCLRVEHSSVHAERVISRLEAQVSKPADGLCIVREGEALNRQAGTTKTTIGTVVVGVDVCSALSNIVDVLRGILVIRLAVVCRSNNFHAAISRHQSNDVDLVGANRYFCNENGGDDERGVD